MKDKRIIAIHLPQFHPFKENDEWWGKGFTEWRNVAKARPRFKGHYQPHIPADLGFYDLRLSETREEQAQMAKEYAIDGFCYYHYWFNGHQLMERPIKEILESGRPNFPFMLCWANENWTRAWDGGEKEILIEQTYSEEDDINHINYLLDNVFSDSRYIRVDGKPVFVIYRSTLFPDINKTIKIWREEAAKRNIELYLCRMESFEECGKKYLGNFDASIEFQPHYKNTKSLYSNIFTKIENKIRQLLRMRTKSVIIDYAKYIEKEKDSFKVDYKMYPCITPMWDNSARRVNKEFFALTNSTPNLYGKWLTNILKKFKPFSKDENFIFINAWNEWAEGNHLEPDMKWGRKYLEISKEIINLYNNIN